MVILDWSNQGKGTIGSYVRFRPGPISLAAASNHGVIFYYGSNTLTGYVSQEPSNALAIELIPGLDKIQDTSKNMILAKFPHSMDDQERELVWFALQAGRRDKH